MDAKNFKKIIKEAVREVIQEELREILLEAVRAPKATIVTESNNAVGNSYTAPTSPTKTLTPAERKAMFGNILVDMQFGKPANTNNIPFRPTPGADTINGALPAGELGLDQIMGLMSK
jgi:hypothetical protein